MGVESASLALLDLVQACLGLCCLSKLNLELPKCPCKMLVQLDHILYALILEQGGFVASAVGYWLSLEVWRNCTGTMREFLSCR